MRTGSGAHAWVHPHAQTHNSHTCKHVATAQLSTLNTLFFHTGVCEKRFPKALHVKDSSTPSPSSSMLMVSRRGVMLPAKKGSLSARAQRHCHLSNIDERGEGLDTLRQHRTQKEPFFADTGIKQRCIFYPAGSVALCALLSDLALTFFSVFLAGRIPQESHQRWRGMRGT